MYTCVVYQRVVTRKANGGREKGEEERKEWSGKGKEERRKGKEKEKGEREEIRGGGGG